jgi:hypothetical protein
MSTRPQVKNILRPYLFLTYLALLVNAFGYVREIHYMGWITPLFVAATYLFYPALYLSPVVALMWLARRVLALRTVEGALGRLRLSRTVVLCFLAVAATGLLQVVLYADRFVFHLYGFHLNGFVWNLVFTRGGLESLGGDTGTTVSFTLIVLGLVGLQAILLLPILLSRQIRYAFAVILNRRVLVGVMVGLIILGAFEQVTYGMSCVRGYAPVVAASNAFPLYAPITFNGLAEKLGMEVRREPSLNLDETSVRLTYPLKPIQLEPPAKPYNLILLVGESLRWDMLTAKIMPATWELAQKSLWCRQHYSGANGTRMAMFAMFYGLYGPQWFSFLAERHGPVLMDVLLDQGYQLELFTSAGFSYPEFDKTIFVRVGAKHMHERICLPQWRCDRQQVGAMLEAIDRRDPSKPFMTFMFFESPHANYHFPPESVVATPYAEGLNYATMDVKKDALLMKNRYINACNHLDSQVRRVIEFLQERALLDSTIVLVTGDHGEEFMEKGRWGHNSSFSEEQTLVPFVLWAPGKEPRELTRMTSHLDVPATLMPLFGVTNPPEDYSFGYDMYGDTCRRFTILSDWNHVGYVDDQYKVTFSIKSYGFALPTVSTKDDVEVPDRDAFFAEHQGQLMQVLASLKAFGSPQVAGVGSAVGD